MSFNYEKISEIEAKTKDILADFYSGKEFLPPIDISKIAEQYGVSIKKGNFKSPTISGAFDRDSKSIYVSNGDRYTRQSFTVAHELGHFLLHKNQKEVFLRQDSFFTVTKDEIEKEADCFAANILMPRDLVERFWTVIHDTDQMASLFNVSFSAMQWRLKDLGFVGRE